jgi:uncharacterized protein
MARTYSMALLLGLSLTIVARGAESSQGPDSKAPPPKLRVLFLGDRGHHRPADRAAQIKPVLAGRGIDMTYTENVKDLNRETLSKFDALLIYANTEAIAPEQEKALLDYVEEGGGFVPLHCASYCFLNSPKYIALVGAQFQRHGTGTFDTKIVDDKHPIMKRFEPFRTWDETYVHRKHNEKDRHVLQVRAEGTTDEPWTWVRTQGKGRVFYTAYGHDARTWQNPSFHDLLERGIRWASAKGEVFDSRPRVAAGLPPFTFAESDAEIPNYLPGRQWGTQGEPIHRMQNPLPPQESQRHLVVPAGFEPRLFAAEPEIYKPLCMTWDERGRLWIAESTDYPNTKRRDGQGRDRITICEDTNGDGRADSFKVFAEGLNIPTSLLVHDDGVIILQAPDTLFLKDTNGDGRADVKKVLFTGWGIADTHAGPSNLRWGLDNWVYGIVGYSAFRGTVGGETVRFGQGLYRFKPDGSKLEFLRSTGNNSWGVGFSEEGLVFGSTANGCPSVYLPIPNRYYEAVRGWSAVKLESIAASNQFYPVTEQVRQVDFHGGFTAAAGHALYTARTYPREYWNSTAFVTEPTGHLVATFTLDKKGSDVADYYGWNMLASDDEWTAPIAAEVGPDGHIWVIDWYNYIVQHNPTPRGFRTGRGNAYETPIRDQTHGRIYRVVYKNAAASPYPVLDKNNAAGLVAALRSDNQLWRLHAQRLLVERKQTDVVPALIEIAGDQSVDSIGLNVGVIHALWTLHGLGAVDDSHPAAVAVAVAALKHPSAGVRRNAIQVLPRNANSVSAIVSAGLLRDHDAQVRMAAFLGLAEQPASGVAADGIVLALRGGNVANDVWLPDAATAAAAKNDAAFLKSLPMAARAMRLWAPEVLQIATRVAEHWARGAKVDEAQSLLIAFAGGEPAMNEAIFRGLVRGWPKDKPVQLDKAGEDALKRLASELTPAARALLVRLASVWGNRTFDLMGSEIAGSLLAAARNDKLAEPARLDAARQLVELRASDDAISRQLLELIVDGGSPELAAGILDAVSQSRSPQAGTALAQTLKKLRPRERSRALRLMLGRSEWAPALVDALEHDQARISELALDQKQALSTHPDKNIAARAKVLLAKGGGLPDADRQKVLDRLTPLLKEGGDSTRGKVVFQEQCSKCHRYGTTGGQVGPDLTGTAAVPRNELLTHIIDPSRSVEGNFVQYSVATKDGRVINGLLSSETKTSVELIDAEAKRQVVLREDIDEMAVSKKSLMPEGFEKQVSTDDIKNLLAFLTQPVKFMPLDLRKAATVVSTKGMFYDENSDMERLIFPDWSPKTVEGVPFALVDPESGRVPNVVLLYAPEGKIPPQMPKSVELTCRAKAKAIHFLSGVSGWGFPYGQKGTVSMVVRLHYADGSVEDHPLENGVHFADYIRVVNVPSSKLAFRLSGRQVRYLAVHPKKRDVIDRIELQKGPDQSAPIVMAVTVEVGDGT